MKLAEIAEYVLLGLLAIAWLVFMGYANIQVSNCANDPRCEARDLSETAIQVQQFQSWGD